MFLALTIDSKLYVNRLNNYIALNADQLISASLTIYTNMNNAINIASTIRTHTHIYTYKRIHDVHVRQVCI